MRRVAGEVATKRGLEELRAEVDGLRREVMGVEARLNERIDRLQTQINERIDRLHERVDRVARWIIAFVVSTWATLVAVLVTVLVKVLA